MCNASPCAAARLMNDSSRRLGALLNRCPGPKAISVQLEAAARLQRALHTALPDKLAASPAWFHCEMASRSSAPAAPRRCAAAHAGTPADQDTARKQMRKCGRYG